MGPKKRTLVLINTCIFCILAYIYNLVVISLGEGSSVLSLFNESTVQEHNILMFLGLSSIFLIYRVKKISSYFFLSFISLTLYSTLSVFLESFDKVILGLNFIYAVLAYYYFLLLRAELSEPYYNPSYSEDQLRSYNSNELSIVVSNSIGEFSGQLTNWGQTGFFCQVEKDRPTGKVNFSLTFKGKVFKGAGVVVYHSNSGVGIVSDYKSTTGLGWKHFYGIMNEFGIRPKIQMV